jgi:hypothetical protein
MSRRSGQTPQKKKSSLCLSLTPENPLVSTEVCPYVNGNRDPKRPSRMKLEEKSDLPVSSSQKQATRLVGSQIRRRVCSSQDGVRHEEDVYILVLL